MASRLVDTISSELIMFNPYNTDIYVDKTWRPKHSFNLKS